MSFAAIRSVIETSMATAFGGMSPAVPVIFDSVQSEPPVSAEGEYVSLNITFPMTVAPIICMEESGIGMIRGTVSINCYGPRAQGMKRLEEMATVAMTTLNTLKTVDAATNICVGQIAGPETVQQALLSTGQNPHTLVAVAAPFTAKG